MISLETLGKGPFKIIPYESKLIVAVGADARIMTYAEAMKLREQLHLMAGEICNHVPESFGGKVKDP